MLNKLEDILSSMKINPTTSRILKYAGITASQQSLSIQVGIALEKFWKQAVPQLDASNTERQVDFFFKRKGQKHYYEIKTNTDLDSEKSKASNDKVERVAKALGADISGYFNPASREDYYCPRTKKDILGVKSMILLLELCFTVEEYEEILRRKIIEKFTSC
jgi:hypothetical protein